MKTVSIYQRAKSPYRTPLLLVFPLSFERNILSGIEGEPIDWDEEIEL